MADGTTGRERGGGRVRYAGLALGVCAVGALGSIGLRAMNERGPAKPVANVEQAPANGAAMIAGLESRLRADPGDAEGWRTLGWSYFRAQRFRDAAGAYARAVRLKPHDAELWSALGEAQTLTVNAVDKAARDAFARAVAIDPKDARARYFLGVEKDVAGDHKGALDDWIALLRDSPKDAPYAQSVHQLVEQVAKQEGIDVAGRLPAMAPAAPQGGDVASAGIPGPSPEQMQAAAALTPTQQDAMARSMVDGLAARLAQNPKDAQGWIRLMRARVVLGDKPAAIRALSDARRVFAGDAATLGRLSDAARTLGLSG
jgi:cytochrome c-type biogenesis protein CcmH